MKTLTEKELFEIIKTIYAQREKYFIKAVAEAVQDEVEKREMVPRKTRG